MTEKQIRTRIRITPVPGTPVLPPDGRLTKADYDKIAAAWDELHTSVGAQIRHKGEQLRSLSCERPSRMHRAGRWLGSGRGLIVTIVATQLLSAAATAVIFREILR